jgi:small subunit ribosomal protein S16
MPHEIKSELPKVVDLYNYLPDIRGCARICTMLKIRLQRVGRKHDPSFRVVVTDSRSAAQSGKALEVLGSYNPRFNNPVLKEDRIKEWIGKGAQVSDTVHNILVGAGIIKGKKVNALPKKVAPVKEEVQEEALAAPAPEAAPEAEAPAS